MRKKTAGKSRKRKPGSGRTVDPQSLRQSGGRHELRIPTSDLARYTRLAGPDGLSALIRQLLVEHFAGAG